MYSQNVLALQRILRIGTRGDPSRRDSGTDMQCTGDSKLETQFLRYLQVEDGLSWRPALDSSIMPL